MWEQLSLAAFLQRHWSDNQVSCTITFDPSEANQIPRALDYFQYQLKGVSFLPRTPAGAYAQMPYEEITQEQYLEKAAKLRKTTLVDREDVEAERYCDSSTCALR